MKTSETPKAALTTEPFFKRLLRSTMPVQSNLRAGRACVLTTDTSGQYGGIDGCGGC